MTQPNPIDLKNLLAQARAICPEIRYVSADVRYGDLGVLHPCEFYAFVSNTCTCFGGETIEELLADIRTSITEAA